MATSDIVSPNGLDLTPKPPNPVRISKRAGMLFLAAGAVVAGMILYGVATRGDRRIRIGFQPDEAKGLTAATDAGKAIAARVPARPVASEGRGARSEELVAPLRSDQRAIPRETAGPIQPVAYPPAAGPAQQYRERTPEELRRELAYQREQEALNAPTSAGERFRANREGNRSEITPQGDVAQLTQLLQLMQGAGPLSVGNRATGAPNIAIGNGAPSQAEEYKLQNAQDEKREFLDRGRSQTDKTVVGAERMKPVGKYEIKAGWDIPAVLEQSLNSDLPGEIKALVRENVYDTATGRHLLIPQGARLVGVYDSRVTYGQGGVQVVWNRIIFPDGSSINLEGMLGQDATGNAGLRHSVDNHYGRLLAFGLLTSAFGAAFQLSQTRHGTVFTYPSPAEVAGSAVAANMSQLGAEVTRRNLNVQPTIKVPIGYRFNVRVNRDLLFEEPYSPGAQLRAP